MSLTALHVAGYRSLRSVRLPLGPLNVVTGPNGSGKSNLYRALWLIAQVAEGAFAQAMCREGGLLSAMWAGPRASKNPHRMTLGFEAHDLSFELNCGFPIPIPRGSLFDYDPEVKDEAVWIGRTRRSSTTLLERSAGSTRVRDVDGNWIQFPLTLSENESVLTQLREPHRYPELFAIREEIRGWRFYHGFRTDESAALRTPQISVRTPVLSHDGRDVAGALQTILEVGDAETLREVIDLALPGRGLEIIPSEADKHRKSPKCTELVVALQTEGCARPLLASELSDGTLKFLCLVAALLSPRPPSLMALNEPESSLHPDLIKPLGKLIVATARHSQMWVSTHSQALVQAIREESGVEPIRLELHDGETCVVE